MAEQEESGHGLDVSGFLWRKTGPLPNAVWIFAVAAIGFYLYKRRSVSTTGGASTATADPGQFSTSSTTTDPNTGSQTTFTANGPNSSVLSPGFLSTQAQPMGYSGGDVYVNYPGQTTAPTTKYPPTTSTAPPVGSVGGWWVTLPADTNPGDLPDVAWGMNDPNPNKERQSVLAADLVQLMGSNPQINWANVNTAQGGKLPAGTPLWVPVAGGLPGVQAKLPPYASLTAPSTYFPPPQTSTMLVNGNQ